MDNASNNRGEIAFHSSNRCSARRLSSSLFPSVTLDWRCHASVDTRDLIARSTSTMPEEFDPLHLTIEEFAADGYTYTDCF